MTEVQRKNLVIAEFIGSKEDSISALKYHESWEWLMPVVGKICRQEKHWSMAPEQMQRIADVLPFGFIEDVHEVVFRFLNWRKEFYQSINQGTNG